MEEYFQDYNPKEEAEKTRQASFSPSVSLRRKIGDIDWQREHWKVSKELKFYRRWSQIFAFLTFILTGLYLFVRLPCAG